MFFDELCDDVVIEIICYLSTESIVGTIPLINKYFYGLSQDQTVWKRLVDRRFAYFGGLENTTLGELYKQTNSDWKIVFEKIYFKVWDTFREDDGCHYSGMYSTWKPESNTLFEETTYTYNNYYIMGPTYGDHIFRSGKHGFVFYHRFENERDQLFGVISIKKESVVNVNEYLEIRKGRFDHYDQPHHPNVGNPMMGYVNYNYHPIFTEVDFFGFCPISGRKVHNFKNKEDIINVSSDENLSEEFRKLGCPWMKCVVMLDLDKKTMGLTVELIHEGKEGRPVIRKFDFGVLYDNLNKGAVVPVLFYSTDDYYKLYAIY